MPDAVIVATGRTPIGRANKGSLVSCRPDDLAALVIKEVLAKVPQLDPQSVEDVSSPERWEPRSSRFLTWWLLERDCAMMK